MKTTTITRRSAWRRTRLFTLLLVVVLLNGCVAAAVVGTAVGATVEIVKIPFKMLGSVVNLACPVSVE